MIVGDSTNPLHITTHGKNVLPLSICLSFRMANRREGVLLRTNKKGRRSAPTEPYNCSTCNKKIKASGLTEFTMHANACKLQV